MESKKDVNEITKKVINLLDVYGRKILKGSELLKQGSPENWNDALILLVSLFEETEKKIQKEHRKSYVTDDYENSVRQFVRVLMKWLLPYHVQLKDNKNYKELCKKRHVAYGYYYIINEETNEELIISDSWYQKTLYLGLAEFYDKFYGSFYDNEEAIELLCKFYPKEVEIESEEHVHRISSALYQHVSNAGTPNDLGYAYQGIKLIEMYIGNLPENVVDTLLQEYALYDIINNNVSRHQIFTIIEHARFNEIKKIRLKFWYLDSLLIANIIDFYLLGKMKGEGKEPEIHNYSYRYKLFDEKFTIFERPLTFWKNDFAEERVLLIEGNFAIGIALKDNRIKVYGVKREQFEMFEYEYTDWMLDDYSLSRNSYAEQIQNFVLGADLSGETFNSSMVFSLVYLDNYRGLQSQVIDFDHRFVYDKMNTLLVRDINAANRIPHIYGKSVYSLSCIVGKNATGKTSVMDFLREAFFRLLKFIEEQRLTCEEGCIREEEYKDYKILDEGAKFLVVFSLDEKPYFLTNLPEVEGKGVKPFRKGIYRSINELSKAAYFSSQLRGDKMELLLDNQEEAVYDEEKRQKQKLSKINNGLRQVDYSEEGSFARKRKAIELARKDQGITGSFNKDICYQLSFLEKCGVEKICEYIDITEEKEFSLISRMHGNKRKTFRLEEMKSENGIMEGLEEFIQLPDTVMEYFSAGQYTKFSFLAKLQWFLESNKDDINRYNKLSDDLIFSTEEVLLEGETALIFIDEGEIYYHPEWQRGYIKLLLEMVNKKERKVQIIVTTNSPFLISDIQNEDITYLPENEGKIEGRKDEGTLGQNIHKLLRDNFFMRYTIGEYARGLIENIMICLQEETEQKTIDMIMGLYFETIENYYDAFHLLIEQIGEPVYKSQLKKMLEESIFAKQMDVVKQINELEEEKRKLQEKIDKLKGVD